MKASTEVPRMAFPFAFPFPFTLSSPPQPIGTLSHLAYVSGVEQWIQGGGKREKGTQAILHDEKGEGGLEAVSDRSRLSEGSFGILRVC